MKISVHDIRDVPQTVGFAGEIDELNGLLRHGVPDYVVTQPLGVVVSYHRAGMDVFVEGELQAQLRGTCSRCATDYPFRLVRDFSMVLAPASELGAETGERRLSADDLALSYYRGDEIDLAPLVHEQLILALPTRPLCVPGCKGLCPQCGASRNDAECGCVSHSEDPRLAVFRTLKVGG